MLKKLFISFIFLFATFEAKSLPETFDQVVSLGFSCQVAWQLDQNGLRQVAYPFDWCQTSFTSLVSFISNKGANFLDFDKLVILGPSPADSSHVKVQDLVYGILSFHDFSPNLENYAEVKEKYERRIQRFFDLLNSNKKVLFVRQGFSKEEIEYLDYILITSYPRLSYTIAAINCTEEYKYNWKAPRIKNFYIPATPSGNWMGSPAKWKEVLSHFSLKPINKTPLLPD